MIELDSHQAFVLHTRPFKEKQALVEMLVEHEGRVSVVANKGSKNNSARNALMQPFRAVSIKYRNGAGLRNLKQIEANPHFTAEYFQLKNKALFCGFYLNEVICRLVKSDSYNPELFPLYQQTLLRLQQTDDNSVYMQLGLRQFEYQLLMLLGYGIDFEQNVETGEVIKSGVYYELFPDQGFVESLYPQRAILGGDILKVHELLMAELNLETVDFYQSQQAQTVKLAKHILSACMHRHLGDKPLKSRELFRR